MKEKIDDLYPKKNNMITPHLHQLPHTSKPSIAIVFTAWMHQRRHCNNGEDTGKEAKEVTHT